MLENITVVDLSGRLPGPHAGFLFSKLGADVIKIEDVNFPDPFLSPAFSQMDQSFNLWYQELNRHKKILKFDYKSQQNEIFEVLKSAHIILNGLPDKVYKALNLHKLNHKHVQVNMAASLNRHTFMHDLNIIAELGHLKSHVAMFAENDIIPPPFYPVAGVYFAHHIVMNGLAAWHKLSHDDQGGVSQITCSLEDAAIHALSPLTVKDQSSYLHNGRYPCYNIYRLKDGFAALAAVEEKFWLNFCECFKLSLSPPQRFHDKDNTIKKEIAEKLKVFTVKEVGEKALEKPMCLTPFI